jgi:hypothetical protein
LDISLLSYGGTVVFKLQIKEKNESDFFWRGVCAEKQRFLLTAPLLVAIFNIKDINKKEDHSTGFRLLPEWKTKLIHFYSST